VENPTVMLGKPFRKHVKASWRDVKQQTKSDELAMLREKIFRALQDLTLCASMESEDHLISRSLPVKNVLGEEAIRPFLMALLDQRENPYSKPKRFESEEEAEDRSVRQRRLGALLVELGARECEKWIPEGAIGESARHDAIRGRRVLIELGRGPEAHC